MASTHPLPTSRHARPVGSAAHIRAEDVQVTLGDRPLLTGVDVTVSAGSRTARRGQRLRVTEPYDVGDA